MSRMSRGCRRCRERRVKCDGGRPACQHCIRRNEVCDGYRDEASIIFRHETKKTIDSATASTTSSRPSSSSTKSSRPRSRSVDRYCSSGDGRGSLDRMFTHLTPDEAAEIYTPKSYSWLKKTGPKKPDVSIEDESIDKFMDKYVMYPCNESSTPGFLEHLPCMFKEVNVEGRLALRYAVQAAAFADFCTSVNDAELAQKALKCYGMSLSALGQSLAGPGKVPDDYDLMTVVMLDIFETFHIQDETTKGMHAQGMAQILRLRGKDQVCSPRGWSLFRLAHHRVQKQQLAYNQQLMSPRESREWIDQLNEDIPFVHLEKNAAEIKDVCERATALQESLVRKANADGNNNNGDSNEDTLGVTAALKVINELLEVDRQVVSWRSNPHWAYKTIPVSDFPTFGLDPAVAPLTDVVALHADIWMIYEWNYHRTSRTIVHEQLIRCIDALLSSSSPAAGTPDAATATVLRDISRHSLATVHSLAEQILATVPQSFGDIDHMGRVHDQERLGPPRGRGIGGYMLLWSIKVMCSPGAMTTADQKRRGKIVFERIREYTGMKSHLGDASRIIQ